MAAATFDLVVSGKLARYKYELYMVASLTIDCPADVDGILLIIVLLAEVFSSFILFCDGPTSNSSTLSVTAEVDGILYIAWEVVNVDLDDESRTALFLLLSELDVRIYS